MASLTQLALAVDGMEVKVMEDKPLAEKASAEEVALRKTENGDEG
ncbi:MAG: hypothetical protein R6U20_03145 [Longimonas sp.]